MIVLAIGLGLISTKSVRAQELDCPYLWEYASPECDDGTPYTGYWWFGLWVPGVPTVESWFAVAPDLTRGAVVYYSPGLMEATARWRGLNLEGYIGGVALPACADIGAEVWIKDQDWEGPFLVVDCARRSDIYGVIVHRNEAVEVDYRTAQRWRLTAGSWPEVIVSKIGPIETKDQDIPRYEDWWLAIYDTVSIWEQPPLYYPGENVWRIDGKIVDYHPAALMTSTPNTIPERVAPPKATFTNTPTIELTATLTPTQDSVIVDPPIEQEATMNEAVIWAGMMGVVAAAAFLINFIISKIGGKPSENILKAVAFAISVMGAYLLVRPDLPVFEGEPVTYALALLSAATLVFKAAQLFYDKVLKALFGKISLAY